MRAVLVLLLVGCLDAPTVDLTPDPELWWVQYPGAAIAAICTFDGETDCAALVKQCKECAVTCWPTEPLRHCGPVAKEK